MEVLKREDIPAPEVRREVVPVEALKGAVIVRGSGLEEALLLSRLSTLPVTPIEGETEQDAHSRNGARVVAHTLHLQVVLGDDKPMWSVEQWLIWAGAHGGEAMALFNVANRLNGLNGEDVLKN